MVGETTPNSKIWQLVDRISDSKALTGRGNAGWGTVNTANQTLSASLNLPIYRYIGATLGDRTYYLVIGPVLHGIQGSPDDPSKNWASVGYYAARGKFEMECTSSDAKLIEFGPNTTVETVTIGFDIGASASVGADPTGPSGEAGVSASVSASFSASEVSFAARAGLTKLELAVNLPGVGWISAGVPANPGKASAFGYQWISGVVFSVQSGAPLKLKGSYTVDFDFDWTRGITNDTKTVKLSWDGTYDGEALSAEDPQSLPTIKERLFSLARSPERDGITDTFIAALVATGNLSLFGETDLMTAVYAISNRGVEALFNDPATGRPLIGPGSSAALSKFIDERVVNLSPEEFAQQEAAFGSLADDGIETLPCSDGILFISDTSEVHSGFADLRTRLLR